jgi:hypothetical protein
MFFAWVDKSEILKEALLRLTSDAQPIWGRMDAQQMIEHLIVVFELSSDDKSTPILTPDIHIEKSQAFLMSDEPMPKNFIAKFLPEETAVYKYKDLQSSIQIFITSIEDYHSYWEGIEESTLNHPAFGALNKKMWDQVHNKHITHHLLQFGLSN